MKKCFITLLILVLSLILLLTLCSCRDNGEGSTDFTDKDEAPVLCEHKWEMKSKLLPTCISEGKTTMECALCGEINAVTKQRSECDYHISWSWENDTSVRLLLECPRSETHNAYIDAEIETITVNKTCTQSGSTTKIATAVHNGKAYTDTYVIDYGFGGHDYLYSYELIGSSCEGGAIRTRTCKSCDKTESDIIDYYHYRKNDVYLYSFEELGLCKGGFVTFDSCLCGESTGNYEASLGGCSLLNRETSTTEGNIAYITREYWCVNCGVTVKHEVARIYDSLTQRTYEGYNITTYKLNEEITLVNAETDTGVHKMFGHELEYTYTPPTKEGDPYTKTAKCKSCPFFFEANHYHRGAEAYELLGEVCTDGVKRTINCDECKNVVEYVYYDHQSKTVLESYSLRDYFEYCDGYATIAECYCGEKLLFVNVGGLIDTSIEETTEKTDTSIVHTMIKKYSHIDLAVTKTTTISLIDGEWVKTSETKSVRLDEQTTLSTTVDYFVILSEGDLAQFNK